MNVAAEIEKYSRVFVDPLSKLRVLTSVEFVDVSNGALPELVEKEGEGCFVYRIPSLGGYVISCRGEVKAASIKEPPALGLQALEFLREGEFLILIYSIKEEDLEDAVKLLEGGVEISERELEELKEKLSEVLRKVGSREEASEAVEGELPEIVKQAPPLEVLDLIDLVTISDEIAYLLNKEGVQAESQPPEEIDHTLVAVIKVNDSNVNFEELIEKVYEAMEKTDLKSLLKLVTPDGEEYYLDRVAFDTILEILRNNDIYEMPVIYIKVNPDNEAILNVILDIDVFKGSIPRVVSTITYSLSTRNFPWKRMYVKMKIRNLELSGEVQSRPK